jgi:hypothetical protein
MIFGQAMKVGHRDDAASRRTLGVNRRVERYQRDAQIGRVDGDARGAPAEDRVNTVVAFERSAP